MFSITLLPSWVNHRRLWMCSSNLRSRTEKSDIVLVELCLCSILTHDYKSTPFHEMYLNGWIFYHIRHGYLLENRSIASFFQVYSVRLFSKSAILAVNALRENWRMASDWSSSFRISFSSVSPEWATCISSVSSPALNLFQHRFM